MEDKMTSKERVIRALKFDHPDRIPIDAGILPASWEKHGLKLVEAYQKADIDIAWLPFDDPTFDERQYHIGTFVDAWGCTWVNHIEGISGQVKEFPLESYDQIDLYHSPVEMIRNLRFDERCADFCRNNRHKFIRGGWVSLFERMQFIRGIENLYIDIAENHDGLYKLRDLVMEFNMVYLDRILQYEIDAITIGDDWGSQKGPLVSLQTWRNVFKPAYQKLIDYAKSANKYVFFHSDGYILDFYDDFIDMGVDAINSQIWCLGLDKVSAYAGRICFWGEISRQTTLPFGRPEDVYDAARQMMDKLTCNNGGLIAQSELDAMTPFENIEAFFNAWKI